MVLFLMKFEESFFRHQRGRLKIFFFQSSFEKEYDSFGEPSEIQPFTRVKILHGGSGQALLDTVD